MDIETVEQLVSLLSEHPVSEIIFERDGFRVVARKSVPPVSAASAAVSLDAESAGTPVSSLADPLEQPGGSDPVPEPLLLTAGMVGLFRHAEPPLGYGAHVIAGQLVGSIEAMKVLNDSRAESAGQVVDVYVEEGAPVEYGQALFRLIPE